MKIKLFVNEGPYMAPSFVEKEFEFTKEAATVLLAAVNGEGWSRMSRSDNNNVGKQVTASSPLGQTYIFTLTEEWLDVYFSAEQSLRSQAMNKPRLEAALNIRTASRLRV